MAVFTKLDLENMLEDVVNELDLSDGMIDKHGPLGTAPAELVRLVLERKDQEIAMLKQGFVDATDPHPHWHSMSEAEKDEAIRMAI